MAGKEQVLPEDYIITYTGKRVKLFDPDPDDVCIEDLAHHLSNICRFTGASRWHYSVAQHSYYVALLSKNKKKGWAHDSPEAFLNDMSAPLKHSLSMAEYRELEDLHYNAICERLGIDNEPDPSVKIADGRVFFAEVRTLMSRPEEFGFFYPEAREYKHVSEFVAKWHPEQAEYHFLDMYRWLWELELPEEELRFRALGLCKVLPKFT